MTNTEERLLDMVAFVNDALFKLTEDCKIEWQTREHLEFYCQQIGGEIEEMRQELETQKKLVDNCF